MLNIFANETVYGGWSPVQCVSLKDAMPENMFDSFDEEAVVTENVQDGYGKSVCFYMNGGENRIYKKLSVTSDLKVGDKVNKNTCFVVVLRKPGKEDIYRISEKKEI